MDVYLCILYSSEAKRMQSTNNAASFPERGVSSKGLAISQG